MERDSVSIYFPSERHSLEDSGLSFRWISGKTSLQKELISTGIGSPGRWLSHHPWMCLKTVWIWQGTWVETWAERVVSVVWLGHGWTQWPSRSFPAWAILWFYDSLFFQGSALQQLPVIERNPELNFLWCNSLKGCSPEDCSVQSSYSTVYLTKCCFVWHRSQSVHGFIEPV